LAGKSWGYITPVAVGTVISNVTKIGLKFITDADPKIVGTIQSAARAVQAMTSLQIVGIFPIPVIPFGSIIDWVLTMIEALLNLVRIIIARIRKKMMEQYSKDRTKAIKGRQLAENKLYAALVKAQLILKKKLSDDKSLLAQKKIRLPQVQKDYETEYSKYMAVITEISTKAKAAKAAGDQALAESYAANITALDPWLGDIMNLLTEKITLVIDIKFLEMDILIETPPCLVQLKKDWVKMAGLWADMFAVAVPYHPDMPDYPNLPPMPPKFTIPAIVHCIAAGLAKWLSTPSLPPMGVMVNATLHCIIKQIPFMIPPVSAQLEAQNDSLIEYMGVAL